MRFAAFVVALLGGLACATLGVVLTAAERRPDKGRLLRGPEGEESDEMADAARAFGIDPEALGMKSVDTRPSCFSPWVCWPPFHLPCWVACSSCCAEEGGPGPCSCSRRLHRWSCCHV